MNARRWTLRRVIRVLLLRRRPIRVLLLRRRPIRVLTLQRRIILVLRLLLARAGARNRTTNVRSMGHPSRSTVMIKLRRG
jgi:hypothetical protein